MTVPASARSDAGQTGAPLCTPNFTLAGKTVLTVADTSGNLLDGIVATDSAPIGLAAPVAVHLSFSETAAPAARAVFAQPAMPGPGHASITTVAGPAEAPHFGPGGDLVPASACFGDGPALRAIGGLSGGPTADASTIMLTATVSGPSAADQAAGPAGAIITGLHAVSMGADALSLTGADYAALLSDHLVMDCGTVAVGTADFSVSEPGGGLGLSGTAIAGGTVKLYGPDGAPMSGDGQPAGGFTVTAAEMSGLGFAMAGTADGAARESTPLVVLDAASVERLVVHLGGSFAASGAIEVDTGKFVDLYQAGSVPPNHATAALVYNPAAHSISLDVPGQNPVELITLGGTAMPQSLHASEIFFGHHE